VTGRAEQALHVANFGTRAIVAIHGAIDADSARDLTNRVETLARSGVRTIVIDLNYCTAVDRAGSTRLAGLARRTEELGIELRVTSIPRALEAAVTSFGLTTQP
jgi:anti-anti-sigma factor